VLDGRLADAEEALGRRYSVHGVVVQGAARGRSLGFRTINVEPDSARKLLPPDGVYAVLVETPLGRFGGMMNLGGRPTFGDEQRTLEAHLFDVNADFYGHHVTIGFVTRLRGVRKFDGAAALMTQLGQDERDARSALTLI
jgi:riboflavin kinase/FMN adenylyltransferase